MWRFLAEILPAERAATLTQSRSVTALLCFGGLPVAQWRIDKPTSSAPKEQIMGYAELIARLQALPQDKQTEVFDFVEFLSARFGVAGEALFVDGDWTDTDFSRMAMAQALRGMEDDPVAYTRSDLREQWQ